MNKPIYIFNSGILKRKDDTLLFIRKEDGEETSEKKTIPVNSVLEFHVFGELDLNKRVLEFLTKYKIPVFFYNHYGYYVGTYYPREHLNSGLMILRQASFYLDEDSKIFLARSFISGAVSNILKNINYYKKKHDALNEISGKIKQKSKNLDSINDINSLMALEGEIRKIYYNSFNIIIKSEDFKFEKRTKHPPDNPINALISFGNSLMYTTILSQIYRTHLDPRIGYLHKTNQRSFSLNLDISEVFKPVITDRLIFSLINKKEITLKHFDQNMGYTYLNDKGRKKFIQSYEDKLKTTINYKNVGKVSYRKLIRMECYKLYKHFLYEDFYTPFISQW